MDNNCNIIEKKHYILLIFYLIKFIFLLIIVFVLSFLWITYKQELWWDIVYYTIFPLAFVIVNYSFLRLILWFIEYYNYLFIIHKDQIFIINSSFILRNDVEVIDAFKIIKIDAYSRWFLPNILWYWKIIIELQTTEVREFRFMANPYYILTKLQEQRAEVLENRKKKYIVDDIISK